MFYYNLKAGSETEIIDALKLALGENSEGEINQSANVCVVMLPGLLKQTGRVITDDNGNKHSEKQKIEGFHCNVASRIKLDFGSIEINPKHKLVGWA